MSRSFLFHWIFRGLLLAVAVVLPLAAIPAHAAGARKLPVWKVEGQSNSVHLLGSIHFLKRSYYPLPDPIEAAFRAAQLVVFEVDFDEAKSPKQLATLQRSSLYEPGDSLPRHVSKKTYEMLQEYLKKSGSTGREMDQLKPWTAAVTIMGLEIAKLGFAAEDGVDQYFFEKAKKQRKQIAGLETLAYQLSFFESLTPAEEDAMLKDALQESSRFRSIVREMVGTWERGDGPALDKLVSGEMRDFPELYQKLLVGRNRTWLRSVEKWAASGTNTFVVVGAAHLVGDDSLVEMLRKKGHSVTQLDQPRGKVPAK